MNQMDLTDIYRTFHPKAKEYSFSSAPHGTFSKIYHVIGHKTDLNKYKKIKIIPCTLSDFLGLRLVLNSNKNIAKHTYTWKQDNTLFNDKVVKEKIKNEIKDFLKFKENENTSYQSL